MRDVVTYLETSATLASSFTKPLSVWPLKPMFSILGTGSQICFSGGVVQRQSIAKPSPTPETNKHTHKQTHIHTNTYKELSSLQHRVDERQKVSHEASRARISEHMSIRMPTI